MPKMKTKSGAAKRFLKTANGIKHKHAFKSHILTKMSTKRKRQLRGSSLLHPSDVAKVKRMLRLCKFRSRIEEVTHGSCKAWRCRP